MEEAADPAFSQLDATDALEHKDAMSRWSAFLGRMERKCVLIILVIGKSGLVTVRFGENVGSY